jgi:hemerythrin superfamily protein
MDTIYDYLKADHKKVADLFKQFEKAPSATAKNDYLNMIKKELIVHAESEEATFYKELEKHRKSAEVAMHGEKEHQEIKDKINEITSISSHNEIWENKVMELKKIVEHHVNEEEGKIFREAKEVFNDYQAYVIREQMHDLKEKIPTRMDHLEVEKK